ncbi:helix-turn-helix transcriptional regulator [Streptomyces sp. NPDC058256]|uniref:helix-turn-helix transcriptional regulator n=1 Tax=Streptomyces sp. NPDC058256 TaxID=3346408 RepID=UPI0036E02CBC
MPVRDFDSGRVREARRSANLTQTQVAESLGVWDSAVANWEKGRAVPAPEKFPRLADKLGVKLDELFPRTGLRDLRDLRCDAGKTRDDTRTDTGTRSSKAVRMAEEGIRRLPEDLEVRLAEAYGVTPDVLRAAQERSFGHPVPEPREPAPAQPQRAEGATMPADPSQTVAAKIGFLLAWMPEGQRPSDAEIAERGNESIGRQVLDEATVAKLRTGDQTVVSDEVRDALARALNAPGVFFSDDEDVQRLVGAAMLLREGIVGLAARGGVPPLEVVAWIAEAVSDVPDDGTGTPER